MKEPHTSGNLIGTSVRSGGRNSGWGGWSSLCGSSGVTQRNTDNRKDIQNWSLTKYEYEDKMTA